DQQALKVAVLLPQRIADLRLSIKFGGQQVRHGSLPLHGSPDRSSVLDGYNLVTRLSGRKFCRESDQEQSEQAKHVLHIHPLEKPRPGVDEPVRHGWETQLWRRMPIIADLTVLT